MKIIRIIKERIGMDGAIAYGTGARIAQMFTGPISILFISRYLTGVEQGFYYTFGSILAIQVFFELGLNWVLTQFVAHEACHLTREADYTLTGPTQHISRLASILHWTTRCFGGISLAFLICLIIIGFTYFHLFANDHPDINWKLPWIIISISTAINLFQSPLVAFLKGLNFVKEMNKLSFIQQFILPLASWISLFCGCKLYVVGISSILSTLFWFVFLYKTGIGRIFSYLWNVTIIERISYKQEIFPLQWRIALSWISGYFIFNIFNAVLFATDGPIVAGQMGMTLQVLNAIQAIGFSWINTKTPILAGLIAKQEFTQLDAVFSLSTRQMILVLTIASCVFLVALGILDWTQLQIGNNLLRLRFLPYTPTLLLVGAMIINMYVGAIAVYLRCHKKEPFLWNSIVGGLLCGTSTILMGKIFGVNGITSGYFIITLIMSFWGQYIYVTCKHQWHNEIHTNTIDKHSDL